MSHINFLFIFSYKMLKDRELKLLKFQLTFLALHFWPRKFIFILILDFGITNIHFQHLLIV